MPGGSLESIAADAAFPTLAIAVEPDRVLPLLARALGERPEDTRLRSIEILNYKLRRRCTILYELEAGEKHLRLVGKWYRPKESADMVFRKMEALYKSACSSIALPKPIFVSIDHGLVLQEYVDGSVLRDLLMTPARERVVGAAAAWLSALHALPPLPGLALKTLAWEIEKTRGWSAEIAAVLPDADETLLKVSRALETIVARIPASEPVIIHRDFYPANLLWDGDGLWGLDFDQIALGHPAMDVASFLIELASLSLKATGDRDAFQPAAIAFLREYQRGRESVDELSLLFFKAYTSLRLAANKVRRRPEGWKGLSRAFIDLAVQAAASGLERSAMPKLPNSQHWAGAKP